MGWASALGHGAKHIHLAQGSERLKEDQGKAEQVRPGLLTQEMSCRQCEWPVGCCFMSTLRAIYAVSDVGVRFKDDDTEVHLPQIPQLERIQSRPG